MQKIDFMLNTTEIAEMMETTHWELLRKLEGRTQKNGKHIKGYVEILTERQMSPSDFFILSTYKDSSGKENKCYKVTKKGCEFLANKFTGEKGVLFTARYINRFHEMQDILSNQETEPQLPWFIRKFRGKYIMLFRDFETVTGISLHYSQPFWKAHCDVINNRCPLYWNGWGWHTVIDKEEFLKEYGFEYGDDDMMSYFYLCGIKKALQLCREDKRLKLEQSSYDEIMGGLKAIEPPRKEIAAKKPEQIQREVGNTPPIQISIVVGGEQKTVVSSTEIAKGGVV